MEAKLTPVEWLEIEIRELEATREERSLSLHLDLFDEYFRDAKKMEQLQKETEYIRGFQDGKQYYKDEYGNKR
jgi:hypothetical protein